MVAIACNGNAINDVTVEGGDLSITQTVNHYGMKSGLMVPRELSKPGDVFDRQEETDRFERGVKQGVDVVFVNGASGIGKTTCLIKWANSLKESYPDGQLFIDASQYREHGVSSPQALQIRAAAACGCGSAQLRNCADFAALYRSLTAGKHIGVYKSWFESPCDNNSDSSAEERIIRERVKAEINMEILALSNRRTAWICSFVAIALIVIALRIALSIFGALSPSHLFIVQLSLFFLSVFIVGFALADIVDSFARQFSKKGVKKQLEGNSHSLGL